MAKLSAKLGKVYCECFVGVRVVRAWLGLDIVIRQNWGGPIPRLLGIFRDRSF